MKTTDYVLLSHIQDATSDAGRRPRSGTRASIIGSCIILALAALLLLAAFAR